MLLTRSLTYCDNGLIVVFKYAADASGSDDLPILTVAGWIADDEVWARIEADWATALNGKIPFLHMRTFGTPHCKHGTGSWPKDKREELLRKLSRLLRLRCTKAFGAAVVQAEYRAFMATSKYADVWGSPYSGCAQSALAYVEGWAHQWGVADKLAYVFEDGDRKHELLHAYDEARRTAIKQFGNVGERSLAFLGKESVALQAADLIAYEFRDVLQRALSQRGNLNAGPDKTASEVRYLQKFFTDRQDVLFHPNGCPFFCVILHNGHWREMDVAFEAAEKIRPDMLTKRRKSSQKKKS